MFLQCLLDEALLHVEWVTYTQINFMISLSWRILFQLFKSFKSRSACEIIKFLSVSCILTDFSVRNYSHMRCEKYKKTAIFRNTRTISFKTSFTNEWNPSKTSHLKTLSPKLFKSIIHTAVLMIDFIDADAACKISFFSCETLR